MSRSILPSPLQGYFQVTRTFTYSAIFVLPLLMVYEVLIGVINRTLPVRNGADAIIQFLLYFDGAVSFYTVSGLLALALIVQLVRERRRYDLTLRRGYFVFMAAESLVYASLLGGVSSTLTRAVLPGLSILLRPEGALQRFGLGTQLVLSVGAGIYEEFVFRVLIVSGLAWLLALLFRGWRPGMRYAAAAVVGALIFSSFHYIGSLGDPFNITTFTFRFMAGLVLNLLYVTRGYGIAVWTHAVYDVLVTLGGG
jgi:membrane protease YdiL (CAAX protease family)